MKSNLAVSPLAKPRKNFTWSYSALKGFESCPSRYHHVNILKDFEEDNSPELDRGNRLHKAMYGRVTSGMALPKEFIYMEDWAKRLTKVFHPYQIVNCEQKLAMTEDHKVSAFMGRDVYMRGLIDYIKLLPRKGGGTLAHIVDFKTGKPKHDETQLMLNSELVFAHYTDVNEVRAYFLWTEYDDTSQSTFVRDEMPALWEEVTPRVMKLKEAWEKQEYPAIKCGLCREYCPVSSCEHWGAR